MQQKSSTAGWSADSDEDRDLVRRCLAGDETGFEALVHKYQQPIFKLVYHNLGPHTDVEDVSQKIFTKVYFSLPKFDISRPFFPWLYRIAVNQCHDESRNRRRNRIWTFTDLNLEDLSEIERIVSLPAAETPKSEVSPELHALAVKMLDKLRPRQRTALVLRDMEDMPYEKIAEILKCSEQAARLKVFRARARLKDLVLKSLRRRRSPA